MKTQAYWILLLSWASNMIVYYGFIIHSIPFLTDSGISRTEAGVMLAMMIFFTIPSRFIGGLLTDRVSKDRMQFVAAGALFIQAIGIIAFITYQNITMAYIFLIFFGLGNGAITPIRLAAGARYYGRKAFTSILGIMMLFITPISMLSPIYTGWIHDTTGSYTTALLVFTVLSIFSAIIMCLIGSPKPPEGISNIERVG